MFFIIYSIFFGAYIGFGWDFAENVNCKHTVESRNLEVDGTIFYKFKLPEVQISLYFG